MDLSKFNVEKKAEEGADLELLDPAGEPMMQEVSEKSEGKKGSNKKLEPVTITLLGHDSKVWRNHNRDVQRKRTQKMVRNRAKNVDYTVSDEDTCEMLAACTVGWKHLDDKGKEIVFSKNAAYDLYMKHIWIREQADSFIGDRANFFTTA